MDFFIDNHLLNLKKHFLNICFNLVEYSTFYFVSLKLLFHISTLDSIIVGSIFTQFLLASYKDSH